jgi:DNA-binding response OmpR family regulator
MPRLLIVEDEAHIVTLLSTKFRNAGYEIALARDGETGLEQATTSAPDVILLDVMMPKLDGYEVCRAIKAHYGPHCPLIVMLSARSQAADRQRGMAAGCDDYVTKPFRPAELLERVEALLRAREMA